MSMASKSGVNIAESMGIPPGLAGERLALFTTLSEKARSSYPPPFQNSSPEWGKWLAMIVNAFAPFVNEDTGELEWMEETRYG